MPTAPSPARGLAALVAAGLVVLGIAGCSSSDTAQTAPSASATAPGAAQTGLCSEAETARTSFQALADTEILREGTDTFRARYAALQASAEALLESAQAEFAPEVDAVRSSLTALQDAVGGLTDSPSRAAVAAVRDALEPVGQSLTALTDSVSTAC